MQQAKHCLHLSEAIGGCKSFILRKEINLNMLTIEEYGHCALQALYSYQVYIKNMLYCFALGFAYTEAIQVFTCQSF
jgi:hypothetical protein